MNGYDAVVVGGGPGGSTVAWRLARGGAKVLVLDAATFPRVKLCAGWVTKQVLRDLEFDPAAYPHTIQPFEAIYVGYGDKLRETRWREPASYGIIRAEFDTFLLRRAEAAGAAVREGVRVRGLERAPGGVCLDLGGEKIETPLVVGAGGHTCPVARAWGDISVREEVVLTQESETRVGADRLRAHAPNYGLPELFAEPDFKGYAWYFTKGEFLNIGVGCLGKKPSVHERRDALLERFRRDGRLPSDFGLTAFKGHAYSIRRGMPRRVAGERFLLVGDAAGLAKDFSGEGIGPATRSARLAADAILAWREGRADLGAYGDQIATHYGAGEAGLADKIIGSLPDSLVRAVAKTLCGNAWLRRRVVLEGAFGIG